MLRPLEPFREGEELYRLLAKTDVDGDRIKETAIDTNDGARGTSFLRSEYCKIPDLPLTAVYPLAARMMAADLPEPIVDGNGASWSFVLVDDPLKHIAHAEVRYRKGADKDPRGNRIKSSFTKLLISEALARKLKPIV